MAFYNYTDDVWIRLVAVQRPGISTPQTIATYRYDGLGRRIYKKVENTGPSTCHPARFPRGTPRPIPPRPAGS